LLQLHVGGPYSTVYPYNDCAKALLPFRDLSEYILGYYLKIVYDHISLQPFMLTILACLPILHYIVYVVGRALLKTYESKPLKALIM